MVEVGNGILGGLAERLKLDDVPGLIGDALLVEYDLLGLLFVLDGALGGGLVAASVGRRAGHDLAELLEDADASVDLRGAGVLRVGAHFGLEHGARVNVDLPLLLQVLLPVLVLALVGQLFHTRQSLPLGVDALDRIHDRPFHASLLNSLERVEVERRAL